MDELKQKTISGLAWNSGRRLSHTVSNLVITLVLVRYLSPAEFGELAMVTVFSGFAILLLDFGLGNALIQKNEISEKQISTVFWLSFAIGLFFAGLFYILAPSIASFYDTPRLKLIARVVAFVFILNASGGIPGALLIKRMQFKQLFLVDITAILVGGVIAIIMAHQGYGVWSIVQLLITQSLITVMMTWSFSKWRPQLYFNFASIKSILPFGLNLTGNSILNYAARNLDNLLIGKVMGEGALGIYSKAYSFLMLPLKNITQVFNQVLFPSFSAVQDDHTYISNMYLKAVSGIALLTFPFMMLLFILSETLVLVFFGKEWLAMIPLIQVFCFLGMIQSILGTTGSLFLSQNRTDLVFKFSIVTKIILFIGLFIAVQYSLIAVAYCWLIFSIVTGYVQLYLAVNLVRLKMLRVFKSLLPALFITGITAVVVHLINSILIFEDKEWLFLVLDSLLFGLVYISLLYFFKVKNFNFIIDLIKKRYSTNA